MLIKNKLLIILNYYNNIYNIINYNIIDNKLLIYLKNSQIDITIENGDIIKYITTKANIIKKYNNKIEYIENRKQHRRIYIKPFISNRILKSETKKTVVKDYYKDYIWLFFRYKKKDELACYKKRIKIEYINNEIHNTITNTILVASFTSDDFLGQATELQENAAQFNSSGESEYGYFSTYRTANRDQTAYILKNDFVGENFRIVLVFIKYLISLEQLIK